MSGGAGPVVASRGGALNGMDQGKARSRVESNKVAAWWGSACIGQLRRGRSRRCAAWLIKARQGFYFNGVSHEEDKSSGTGLGL